MKIRVLSILFSLLLIYINCISAQVPENALKTWQDNKLAMQIVFTIPRDYKGNTAREFDYTKFNADSITEIAKDFGMRTIISPVKVGNMYLFNTSTDNNSLYRKYNGRDFIKELAEACRKNGIRLGLHIYNTETQDSKCYPANDKPDGKTIKQITELLTAYGDISEIHFDSNPISPETSKELYELVHKLRPDCMVSNGCHGMYDICDLSTYSYDKEFIECNRRYISVIHTPLFILNEGDAQSRAIWNIREMSESASCGGGFVFLVLIDNGYRLDYYRKETIRHIGAWLKKNGDAIYGAERTPFIEDFDWGTVTRKGNILYLILSGKYPEDGRIKLYMPEYELEKADGKLATCIQKNGLIDIAIPASAYKGNSINVLTLTFKQDIKVQSPEPIRAVSLKRDNAIPLYSITGFDHKSTYKSTVKYSWYFEQLMLKQLELIYTGQEKGKNIEIELDGKTYNVCLDKGKPSALTSTAGTVWGKQYICGPDSGILHSFHAPQTLKTDLENPPVKEWKETAIGKQTFAANANETYYVMQDIESPKEQDIIVEAGAGNGIEIYLNGVSIMKHLNPYGCKFRTEKVLLPLQKGNNRIVMRIYNRFEKNISYMLRQAEEQTIYKQDLTLPEMSKKKNHKLTVRQSGLSSEHNDTELSNLRIRLRRIAL